MLLAPLRSALAPTAFRRTFASTSAARASTLLFIEHKGGAINQASLVALTAAGKIGGEVHGVVVGSEGVEGVVEKAKK